MRLVRDYTGLEPRRRMPTAEVVDRREWIEANIASLRAMSGSAEAELAAVARPAAVRSAPGCGPRQAPPPESSSGSPAASSRSACSASTTSR